MSNKGDDTWVLICRTSLADEGMESTKVYEIPGVGCLVQVTTQQEGRVAVALEFVPGVQIDVDGDRPRLVPVSPWSKLLEQGTNG